MPVRPPSYLLKGKGVKVWRHLVLVATAPLTCLHAEEARIPFWRATAASPGMSNIIFCTCTCFDKWRQDFGDQNKPYHISTKATHTELTMISDSDDIRLSWHTSISQRLYTRLDNVLTVSWNVRFLFKLHHREDRIDPDIINAKLQAHSSLGWYFYFFFLELRFMKSRNVTFALWDLTLMWCILTRVIEHFYFASPDISATSSMIISSVSTRSGDLRNRLLCDLVW